MNLFIINFFIMNFFIMNFIMNNLNIEVPYIVYNEAIFLFADRLSPPLQPDAL